MDWQNLINIAGGAALATIGWFARQLWDSVKELKADIGDLRLHVSETYVKKSEMERLKPRWTSVLTVLSCCLTDCTKNLTPRWTRHDCIPKSKMGSVQGVVLAHDG